MTTKSCANCAKEFEGNDKQIFCGTVCKQQAYRKRKDERLDQLLQMKFSLEEYRQIIETDIGKSLKDNFILFCYIRKNLPQNVKFDNLLFFIKSSLDDFNYATDSVRENLSWKNFNDKFMSGELIILEKYE